VLQADGRVRKADFPPKIINAAAGLVSTVRDLARFDAALNDSVLLTPESRQLAWSPFVSSTGVPQPYGLGWFVQTSEGVPLVWHYGYWEQYSSLYLRLPQRDLTLILLANSGELSARFNLAAGNVTGSPFARLFLRIFAS
jgi:CubicO group peptidase (beta-lactamase class C family)